MEVNLNKAKQEFMNIVKRKLKIMAIKVVAVISIIVMLACFCYVIWDATIGKAIDVFGNTITSLAKIFTNESGSKLEIDSGDLEDNLVKELEAMNLDVDTLNIGTKEGDKDEKLKYLKKYLAAEVVTLYPNVSVDQGLFKRDLQGIVTIEKLTANGSAQKLKYKSYDDFKEDLESGDSDVNNYFTINSNNDVIVAKRTVENDVTTYSEQKIEYQNTISGYTMPFEFLLSLAQITQNPEYVAAVADLIIKESEIKVTVFETKTTTTTVETLYYTNNKKKIPVSEATAGSVTEPTIEQETDKSEEIQRTVKEEYTLSTDVTYARVWCGTKKIDEISITENEPTTIPSELSEAPEYIEEEPATEGEWKTDAKKQTIQTIQSQTKKVGQATSEIDTELFMGLWKNSTGKYEKTDFNSDGTMTNQAAKYDKNGKKVKYEVEERGTKEAPIDNILSAPEMLFEFLEKSERTQKQEDFLKYCLYLYTGTDYGVTSLEFSIFDAASFSGATGGIIGNSVEEKIWFSLRSAGYSEYAVAGVMGNIYAESEFNIALIEYGYNDSTGGIGLCQWTDCPRGSGDGRNTQLKHYAASKGGKWTDENIQIEFLLGELSPGGGADGYATYALLTYNGYSPSDWVNASTPEDAAIAFCWSFERPGIPRMSVRTEAARRYYEEFKGKTISSEFVQYYQGDYADVPYGSSNLANCGCGPTCFAMVATNLTGTSITPKDAVAWCGNAYYVWGAGTSWSYFEAANKHFNLNRNIVNTNSIDTVVEALKNGKMVISSQNQGRFTSSGHFIVLYGIDSNNRITVKDPNKNNAVNKGYNNINFSKEEINEAAASYWIFE